MKHAKQQRGYTLIELLLVMSIAVVLMMVNVGWIHQTMKFSSRMDQRQRHHQNLKRLAWELRDDVHQSESLAMDGDNRLVLTQNDGVELTYTISATSVDAERRSNETIIRRETYDLAPNSKVEWETAEVPNWITLIVTRGREGLAEQKLKKPLDPASARDSPVVDLHVRVGPNRWNTAFVQQGAENSEDPK